MSSSINFKPISCSKYERENRIFTRYASQDGAKYLKCDQCLATGVIRDGNFKLIRPHTCFQTHDDDDDGDLDPESDSTDESEDDRDDDESFLTDMIGNTDMKAYDVTWKHPFTSCLAGPTRCGKTAFVFSMIQNMKEMIYPVPKKVIYCYGEFQSIFDKFPDIQFHEGLPDQSMFDGTPILLILDDLMSQANETVTDLFTKGSHHKNISVVFLTQNIFHKNHRTISLNSHYLVLFKNPRDAYQISTLARQMYPGNSQFMVEAYKDATSSPHSHLLLDLHPDQDEKLRLRTNIFPGEIQTVYVRK
jgi:hypothetical protein